MRAQRIRTRRSSPSRSAWQRRARHEQRDHAGAALARGRSPEGGGGARVPDARLGEVEHQRPDARRLLSARLARVPHPAAVHGDGHAGRVRRPRHRRGRRPDGAGGRAAARDRAGFVPGGRPAPQEATGAGAVDAGSARGRAQEAGARGGAQAVPVLEAIEANALSAVSSQPSCRPKAESAVHHTRCLIRSWVPASRGGTGSESSGGSNPERECMAQPQLQDLLEAGVHFGHQTRRWNPKMRRFIFAERSGIYIIDLQKTLRQIEAAQELLRGVVLKGEGVLFVCTKKQLKNIIQAEAERCGAFYVTERWLGGTLTNFQTIKRQIKRLKDLEQGTAEGEFENYTKKEQLLFERERLNLEKSLSGIKNMGRLPGALFMVDSKKERIAVAEANKLGIPVVAIVDTNADPVLISVPIPGNDDAIRAVSLITAAISDVIGEARRQSPLGEPAEEGEGVTYSTETGVEAEAEGDKKKKPARRKRRPKPEAIAARLKTEEAPAPAESSGGGEG